MIDERFTRALHVEALRRAGVLDGAAPHHLFQASTIGALLEGAYEGDVSFAELAAHGNLGLGTVDHLDGEMIALDSRFLRADADGRVTPIDPDTRTPFAVVVPFEPSLQIEAAGPVSQAELVALIDESVAEDADACAIRVDGDFERVRLRSVPRQEPPYRPLVEVVAAQHVFELTAVAGTLVGFRFPDHSHGIEIAGYHLHFLSADGTRGGHVLDFSGTPSEVLIDLSTDLHIELPSGVELTDEHLDESTEAASIARIEHDG